VLRRIGRAFQNELIKAGSLRFLYLGLVLSATLPYFCSEGFKQITREGELTGWTFLTNSIEVAVTSLIPIFTLIYASTLIAYETAYGRYRDMLSRPLARSEFLLAKILVGIFYLLILLGVNGASGMIIGKIRYGFSPIKDGELILVPTSRFLFSLGISYLFILFPLISIFAFGFLVSTLSRSLVGALGFALGIYLGIQPFKYLISIGSVHLDHYLSTSYMDEPFKILTNLAMGVEISWNIPEIHRCVGFSMIPIVLFFGLSFIIFLRRDLNG